MTTFEDLGLSPEVLKAVEECGYTTPTPIQEQAIPVVLMMRDIVGLAQTGTGKTASFTLPMIEILSGGRAKARMPRSLVLVPTRELAAQVAENFDTYGKYNALTKALLVGGESMGDQIKLLDRGVDVLIATPGRLLDLFERGNILLNDIKVLVIDEADRMLDMGFIPDIEKIVSKIPPMRQTLLFSATMPPEIKRLADKFLSNPKTIAVAAPASTNANVRQALVWVKERQKMELLDALIQQEDVKNAFIFCNRKKDIAGLAKFLQNHNYAAAPLHGDMVQSARTKTLLDFKEGLVSLLVCSDVAARGLDVDAVSHVFNFDVPMHADDYVHRIGRTGRAGMTGRAWTMATPDDTKYVAAIEQRIQKPIPVETVEGFDAPQPGEASEGRRDGGREGGRDRGGRGRGGRDNKAGGRNDRGPQQARGPRREDGRREEGQAPRRDDQPRQPREQRPPQAREQRSEQPRPQQQNPQHNKRPRRDHDDDGPASFGDDLPAFLRK
ncbi:DEAD/DEAH box helicase [Micavibrio aeruginosavorus]|uniref:DEAD-box ATP-dependent RNA helicase RhpA n=1 Tax=Micavibrio aeruginosavorus EPB TaxID=349215 RepID=M4VFJ1_9BACT|nr:DEAD/DEAH box helicase [Micavibrio aeruginosavorus]AGH98137.1 ATP-dependent RNA helicase [Micavibrio aeruginosavorus EPB]